MSDGLRILADDEIGADLREAMNGMELVVVDPRTIKRHGLNWHQHPTRQRWAFRDLKKEHGWGSAITVNKRTGRMIDGEMRLDDALEEGAAGVPVILVDVDEGREAALLALMDRVGMLAGTRQEEHDALVDIVQVRSELLRELLEETQGQVRAKHATRTWGGEVDPKEAQYELALMLGEQYNYLVLLFRTEIDWTSAQDHFDVQRVKDVYGQNVSIGRVIDGSKYLSRVRKMIHGEGAVDGKEG